MSSHHRVGQPVPIRWCDCNRKFAKCQRRRSVPQSKWPATSFCCFVFFLRSNLAKLAASPCRVVAIVVNWVRQFYATVVFVFKSQRSITKLASIVISRWCLYLFDIRSNGTFVADDRSSYPELVQTAWFCVPAVTVVVTVYLVRELESVVRENTTLPHSRTLSPTRISAWSDGAILITRRR